jgi:hypothetical protein
MKTYKVAVSGWVDVRVQAENAEEAMDKALEETVAGELYNYEFEAVTEVN